MRANSEWLTREIWVCRNHLPVVRYRAGTQKCWYHGCLSARPPEEHRPAEVIRPVVVVEEPPAPVVEVTKCAWKDCQNAVRPGSKYCSRNCSNKNARYRHRQRRTDENGVEIDDEDEETANP